MHDRQKNAGRMQKILRPRKKTQDRPCPRAPAQLAGASGNFLFIIDRFLDEFTIKIDDFLKKMIFENFSNLTFFFNFFEKMRFQRNNVQITFLSKKIFKSNTNDSE